MSELALQLIQQEKEEKTGYLDLGRCGLIEKDTGFFSFSSSLQNVWDALGELTHLETLIFSNYWYGFDKKTKTWLWNQSLNQGKENFLEKIPTVIADMANLKTLVIAGDIYEAKTQRWGIWKIENLPPNILTLNVSHNQITKIRNLPPNISNLSIFSNYIGKLENLPQGITKLNISYNKIGELKNLPPNISILDISHNKINKLENLPPNISILDISYNKIVKLENLTQSISTLDINCNQISILENLPQSISRLDISCNQIKVLENLPQNLSQLDISDNRINDIYPLASFMGEGFKCEFIKNPIKHDSQFAKYLIAEEKIKKTGYLEIGRCGLTPNNPLQDVWDALGELTHLKTLILSDWWKDAVSTDIQESQNRGEENLLDKIPNTMANLVNLEKLIIAGGDDSHEWRITKLENLPENIRSLYISHNQISKLENLPKNIKGLNIGKNQVTKIENLPPNILTFDITSNKITKLENLPDSLYELRISGNQITKIENLPPDILTLVIFNNQITDLKPLFPFLQKGINCYFDNNPIKNPPIEVVDQGKEAILRYFEELQKSGEIQVKEAKLLLTGSGEVGKTSLRYRLNDRAKELPKKEERTKQVDVEKYHFITNSQENFTAYIWDFGG